MEFLWPKIVEVLGMGETDNHEYFVKNSWVGGNLVGNGRRHLNVSGPSTIVVLPCLIYSSKSSLPQKLSNPIMDAMAWLPSSAVYLHKNPNL